VGLWPLLHRAFPDPGSVILSGFLAAVLYVSTTLVPSFYELTLPKQHQFAIVGMFLFIAIWRDEARVFWALPLLLLFDLQNGARLCALVVAGESLIGLRRRQIPTAILPAALTAPVGVTVTRTTAVYPFGERLCNVSDAVGVMTTPVVLTAGFVALAIVWATWDRRRRETASPLALDARKGPDGSNGLRNCRPEPVGLVGEQELGEFTHVQCPLRGGSSLRRCPRINLWGRSSPRSAKPYAGSSGNAWRTPAFR
jgi:hypothetical protein